MEHVEYLVISTPSRFISLSLRLGHTSQSCFIPPSSYSTGWCCTTSNCPLFLKRDYIIFLLPTLYIGRMSRRRGGRGGILRTSTPPATTVPFRSVFLCGRKHHELGLIHGSGERSLRAPTLIVGRRIFFRFRGAVWATGNTANTYGGGILTSGGGSTE